MKRKGMLLIFLLITAWLGQTGISMMNLAMVFFAKNRLFLSAETVGVLASVGPVAYFLSLLLLKPVTASLRPRQGILAASAGMMLIPPAIAFLRGVWWSFLLYGLYGMCMALFWPAVMGWISRGRESLELGTSMGKFNVAWSLGVIFGPYWAGVLSEIGPEWALSAAGGTAVLIPLLIGLASVIIPEVRGAESGNERIKQENLTDRSTKLRYLSWIGLFTGYVIFGITTNIFPMHAQDVLQYPEGRIGLLLLIRGGAATAAFYIAGKLSFWQHNRRIMYAAQGIIVLVCLYGMIPDTFLGLLLFMAIFGICYAHVYTAAIFHGVSGSIDREGRMAVHEAVLTAGLFCGSVFGGLLYAYGSFSASMLAAAAVGFSGLVLQVVVHRLTVSR